MTTETLTDLEVARLCGVAMGKDVVWVDGAPHVPCAYHLRDTSCPQSGQALRFFSPADRDDQAMALVERFRIQLNPPVTGGANLWWAFMEDEGVGESDLDMKRAIAGAVAKLQKSRATGCK
jgi:hypothetical protein